MKDGRLATGVARVDGSWNPAEEEARSRRRMRSDKQRCPECPQNNYPQDNPHPDAGGFASVQACHCFGEADGAVRVNLRIYTHFPPHKNYDS
jgi:hypothetical protein